MWVLNVIFCNVFRYFYVFICFGCEGVECVYGEGGRSFVLSKEGGLFVGFWGNGIF